MMTAAEIDADPTIFKPRPNDAGMNRRIARQLNWNTGRKAARIRELRTNWMSNELALQSRREGDDG